MIYLYGASGHAKVIIEIAEALGFEDIRLIDRNEQIKELLGYPVSSVVPFDRHELLVSIGDNQIRKRVALSCLPNTFISLVHPKATISKRASVGEGTVVMAGATVNSSVMVGKHCIINTNSSIDHECTLGDFVHISPNAALAGNVQVAEGVHIGIGACVKQGIKIGEWSVIGAGAVVVKDVPPGTVVFGNPAKVYSR